MTVRRMMPNLRRRPGGLRLLWLLPLTGLIAGCLPSAATTQGRAISDLYVGFLLIGAIIATIVFGLATFAILRYRRRGGDGAEDGLPVQRKDNIPLEIAWTAIPVLIVLGLFVATVQVLGIVDATSSGSVTEVHVEAHRWGWTFTYPGTDVTISGDGNPGPEVVLPVGEPVRVTLTATDVVHAFYVPDFLFKRDAIPGRPSTFEFTIQDPGTYRGQCAEFCGILHSQMLFSIRAVSPAEFQAWLASAAASPGASGAPPAATGAPPAATGAPR